MQLDGILPNPPDSTTRLAFQLLFNGASWDGQRTPNVFKTVSGLVITAAATIWTPANGKRFRLMGFIAAQGVVTGAITLQDGGAGFFVIPQHTVGVAQASPPMGNGYLSTAANNLLQALGASTETLTGTFFGTEE